MSFPLSPFTQLDFPDTRLIPRDEYLPVTYFDAIYLIDLCEPLLEVARQRFKAKGWKNVHCLRQDASAFVLPEWESGALDPRGSITAITLSYSLSMVRGAQTYVDAPLTPIRFPHSTSCWTDAIRSLTPSEVCLASLISTPREMLGERSG